MGTLDKLVDRIKKGQGGSEKDVVMISGERCVVRESETGTVLVRVGVPEGRGRELDYRFMSSGKTRAEALANAALDIAALDQAGI